MHTLISETLAMKMIGHRNPGHQKYLAIGTFGHSRLTGGISGMRSIFIAIPLHGTGIPFGVKTFASKIDLAIKTFGHCVETRIANVMIANVSQNQANCILELSAFRSTPDLI